MIEYEYRPFYFMLSVEFIKVVDSLDFYYASADRWRARMFSGGPSVRPSSVRVSVTFGIPISQKRIH